MSEKPQVTILYESVLKSIISDCFTFAVTVALVFIADGRSTAWQAITIGMFIFWIFCKIGFMGRVNKFYSKQELLEWAKSLPEKEATK